MTTNRVRAVQQRRQSSAAGPHGRRASRADELAAAIADWEDEKADTAETITSGGSLDAAEGR